MFANVLQTTFSFFLIGMASLLTGCACTAETNASTTFRVMSYNIHHAEGTDGKIDVQRIADLILREKADIIGLQEIDRGVERTARRDLIKELSKLTGMEFYFDRNIHYQGGEYGNAVLTRFPILKKKNTHYKMIRPNEQRGILQLVLNVNGRKLMFMDTHIDFRDDDEERAMNVREIKTIVAQSKELPIIIVGDFNSTPDSKVYANLANFLDDAWMLAGNGDGFTLYSHAPDKRIDYIWVSKSSSMKPLKIWIPQSNASDHLPVMAEFELP